jgi:hypothetical protein
MYPGGQSSAEAPNAIIRRTTADAEKLSHIEFATLIHFLLISTREFLQKRPKWIRRF